MSEPIIKDFRLTPEVVKDAIEAYLNGIFFRTPQRIKSVTPLVVGGKTLYYSVELDEEASLDYAYASLSIGGEQQKRRIVLGGEGANKTSSPSP